MPLKIELQGHGAGSGTLRAGGRFDTPESIALAIQRNDGLYLGPGQNWQSSPHWHPQFTVRPEPGGLSMELSAEIIDGVIDAGGVPLKVSLRMDDREEFGVLRIRGELIGSGAAAQPPPAAPPVAATDIPLQAETAIPDVILDPESDSADAPPILVPDPPDHRTRRARKSRWPLLLLLLLLLLLGAAAGGWYLGLFDPLSDKPKQQDVPITATTETNTDPARMWPEEEQPPATASETTTETAAESPQQPDLSPDPTPQTGLAFVRRFLAGHPAADAIFAQGSQAEQAGDCDAALVLFNTAANQDPAQAAKLAGRYDPEGFQPGPCIDKPDAPYAIIFYGDAAATGAVEAQRRLGLLLTAREASGPTFEEGLGWLRKAAAAGDAQAQTSLAQLEKRP